MAFTEVQIQACSTALKGKGEAEEGRWMIMMVWHNDEGRGPWGGVGREGCLEGRRKEAETHLPG
jgi:hypothetical protein